MHWTVFALLLIIAALVIVIVHLLERLASRRDALGAQPMPSRRQRRQWRRERLRFAHQHRSNRRRAYADR